MHVLGNLQMFKKKIKQLLEPASLVLAPGKLWYKLRPLALDPSDYQDDGPIFPKRTAIESGTRN